LKLWQEKMEREKAALIRFQKAIDNPNLSQEKRAGYQETVNQIKDGIQYLEKNKP
jgi:hypothetical protein